MLRLHVQWIPKVWGSANTEFTVEQAKEFMLRTETSQLRAIAVGPTLYTVSFPLLLCTCGVLIPGLQGTWILDQSKDNNKASNLRFQVSSDIAEDRWQT